MNIYFSCVRQSRVPAAALARKADVILMKASFVGSIFCACWVPCSGAWVPENKNI